MSAAKKSDSMVNKAIGACVHSAKPVVQVILMLITASIFYGLSQWPQRKFISNDPAPNIKELVAPKGKPVKTGMYIRNFMDFDPIKNNFVVDAVVWFESDNSVSTDLLGKFIFGKGEINKISDPQTETLPNDRKLVRYNTRITFPSNLNHKLFPFGDHTLYINLTNRDANTDNIYFVSDPDSFVVADSVYTVGWRVADTWVKSGKTVIELDKADPSKKIAVPRTVFATDFKDLSPRELWIILLPLFIFFFVALFSFSIDPDKYFTFRASMCTTSLSATLSYRYVIQNLAPRVEYAIFSDYIFFMFLVLVFLAATTNLMLKPRMEENSGFVVLLFHLALNITWATLIFYNF